MSDSGLIDVVAQKTGEDSHVVRRRGFVLTGPDDASPDHDPECLFDLVETGTVDWGALGFGCRELFYKSTLKVRLKKKRARRSGPMICSALRRFFMRQPFQNRVEARGLSHKTSVRIWGGCQGCGTACRVGFRAHGGRAEMPESFLACRLAEPGVADALVALATA
jgi:hypothetical protein